jgi:hypothetical protein
MRLLFKLQLIEVMTLDVANYINANNKIENINWDSQYNQEYSIAHVYAYIQA